LAGLAAICDFVESRQTLGRSSNVNSTQVNVPTMTTQEIAERLVAYCREAKWEAAQRELYAENAVSIEPFATPAFEKETRGLAAILEKGRKFDAMVEEMHSVSVSEPLVAGNSFACTMGMDVTMKGQGRMNMSELCVYEVKDGKIVLEQFHM
jgi:hypothetical protein